MALVNASQAGGRAVGSTAVASTRALRTEYLMPAHKEGIPDTLSIVERALRELPEEYVLSFVLLCFCLT